MSKQSFARNFAPTEVTILEAYLRLCARRGVENVTLSELAKESAVAFGTVHYHFGGKKRDELPLCAAVHVARIAQEFTTRLIDQSSQREPYDPLGSYIRANFAWARHHETHASFWIHQHYLTSIRSKLREINGTVLSRARKRIEGILFEAAGRGKLPPLKDVEMRALQIHSLMMGSMVLAITDPTPGAIEREERAAVNGSHALAALQSP